MPSPAELDAYVVYVGFDEIGDKNEKKPAEDREKTASSTAVIEGRSLLPTSHGARRRRS